MRAKGSSAQPRPTLGSTPVPESVVIIGGGPAGNMAAETLRAEGYAGPITMLSADTALPADRPNLSKDYLAGRAPEEWTLLRSADFYRGESNRRPAEHARRRGSTLDNLRSNSPTEAVKATARFCLPPAPSRSGSTFPARTSIMFIICARSTTVAR